MSIENMNKTHLCPRKDYTANRLLSGVLQLGTNTSLVVDETALQPGQLEASGKHNTLKPTDSGLNSGQLQILTKL